MKSRRRRVFSVTIVGNVWMKCGIHNWQINGPRRAHLNLLGASGAALRNGLDEDQNCCLALGRSQFGIRLNCESRTPAPTNVLTAR